MCNCMRKRVTESPSENAKPSCKVAVALCSLSRARSSLFGSLRPQAAGSEFPRLSYAVEAVGGS